MSLTQTRVMGPGQLAKFDAEILTIFRCSFDIGANGFCIVISSA